MRSSFTAPRLLAAAALVGGAALPIPLATSIEVSALGQLAPVEQRCFGDLGSANAAAVVNLTPVRAAGAGNGRLVSSGTDGSTQISNVNFGRGTADPNVGIAQIGADGEVCFVNSDQTSVHLVADHLGTIADAAFSPPMPDGSARRVVDTRRGLGGTRLGPSERRCFAVEGDPGDAALVNLTPVRASAAGDGRLVTSAPSATDASISNVNFTAGGVNPNVAVAEVGADGQVCFINSRHTSVDLVADHLGTIADAAYMSAGPNGSTLRRLDTRNNGGQIAPSGRRCFSVAGQPGDAAIVNLTPVRAGGAGNGKLVSSDAANPPVASNVNFGPGTVDANLAIAPIGADGQVCFVNSAHSPVHLVADHLGTISAASYEPATPSGAPDRRVDTRSETPPPAAGGSMGISVDESALPAPRQGQTGLRLAPQPYPPNATNEPAGAMRTDCRFSHMAFDDPIVFPGQSGRSHLHAFYGNTQAYADMTTTANGAPSTCSGGQANSSAYWAPAMIDTATGTPIVSNYLQIYYKTGYHGVTPQMIQPFPDGLRMIAGDASSSSPQSSNIAWYVCLSNPTTKTAHIPDCSPGDVMVMAVRFPQCWDGRNLDSADHKSHMSYPLGWPDLGCPASHPVALTEIIQHYWYRVPAGGTSSWRLSSDTYDGPAGYSGHADWWNGWDRDVMTGWVQRCVATALDCRMNLMGDGTTLVFPDQNPVP